MDHHDQHQPQQHWKPTNGNVIASVGKYIISFLLGALLYSFVLGSKSQKFDDLLVWRGEVTTEIKKMNDEGTRASQNKLQEEAKDMGRFEERLKKSEDATQKIDTMSFKIDNLTAAVAELKNQKR